MLESVHLCGHHGILAGLSVTSLVVEDMGLKVITGWLQYNRNVFISNSPSYSPGYLSDWHSRTILSDTDLIDGCRVWFSSFQVIHTRASNYSINEDVPCGEVEVLVVWHDNSIML